MSHRRNQRSHNRAKVNGYLKDGRMMVRNETLLVNSNDLRETPGGVPNEKTLKLFRDLRLGEREPEPVEIPLASIEMADDGTVTATAAAVS